MPNSEITKFATFIKNKRTALGMSGSELAEKAFGDKNRKTYISEIESGSRKGITLDIMSKILKALNSEINYIEH